MTAAQIIFLVFSAFMLASAVGVVLARNQVYAAMSLVASFFFLAADYALLGASTIAILQVLVYAGAIMVLFLFVIMLLAIQDTPRLPFLQRISPGGIVVFIAAVGVGVVLVGVSLGTNVDQVESLPQTFGTVSALGALMYGKYLLPFEVTSLLLLVAIVGSVVVAKGKI